MAIFIKRTMLAIPLVATSMLAFFGACNDAGSDGSTQGSQKQEPREGGCADGAAPDAVDADRCDADLSCADELATALRLLNENSSCDTADDCELVSTLSPQLSERSIGLDNGQVLLNVDADPQSVIDAAAALSACTGNLGPSSVGFDTESIVCQNNRCSAASH